MNAKKELFTKVILSFSGKRFAVIMLIFVLQTISTDERNIFTNNENTGNCVF